MKKRFVFFLIMLFVLSGLRCSLEKDPPDSGSIIPPRNDSVVNSVLPTLALSYIKVFKINGTIVEIYGKITEPGRGCEHAMYGICWSTKPDPTINDPKIVNSPILGSSFSFSLSDLSPETTYYVRAYITLNSLVSYSNQLSFTTYPSTGKPIQNAAIYPLSLNCTGVIIGFNPLDNIRNYPITEKGICLATTPNPTVKDKTGYIEQSSIEIGSVTYQYRCEVDHLQPGTLNYARSFFIYGTEVFYGDEISFSTNSAPLATITSITEITQTSAKVNAKTIANGSYIVERGISYSTLPDAASHDQKDIEQEVQSYCPPEEFSVTLTNLTPGTLYYVRSFVGVMTGIEYGDQLFAHSDEVTFTTKN
ncbi:MAG: fibronectin type III domain-containing protein [Bacteroidota bacterium]|nr:fibronectin type III domain-containing protein [Bacteroidota bacterium]